MEKELEKVECGMGLGVMMDSPEIAVNKFFSDEFTKLPMSIRIHYILMSIANIPSENISYSRINAMLHTSIREGDYNIIPEINSMEDITQLYANFCSAISGLTVWCERTCKDCGKKFYLYLSEVDFYKNKGLALPKRCKDCINSHKSEQTPQS